MADSDEADGGISATGARGHEDDPHTDCELDIRGAYLLVVHGNLQAMRSQASRVAPLSLQRIILGAAIAQNEGRMDRCRAQYERALKAVPRPDFPYLVDLIAPLLIMDGNYDRYEELREACEVNAELSGMFAAMDAISAARRGEFDRYIDAAQRALAFADESESEIFSGRLLQRLAYAALHQSDFTLAAELAARSARTFEVIGASRPAAISYSIAYNAYHAGTGDIDRAEIYAGKIVDAARRSGDTSLENVGLIAQYEIACECGDDGTARALRYRIDTLALPEQYAERFARGIGDVILAAVSNDLATFHANAVLLRDALATDRATMALASALRSLGAAAVGEFAEARRLSRNALGLASLRNASEPAYNVRYRKLARALAASTCLLIGDNVRARRATARHLAHDDHGLLILLSIAQGADPLNVPRRIRGYARVIGNVHQAVASSSRHSVLSAAEFVVLDQLAHGLSAPQIAAQSGRSVHTIRAHTRSIIAKFGVQGKSAAIAYAYRNRLLSQ